jgi:hypothetical protein
VVAGQHRSPSAARIPVGPAHNRRPAFPADMIQPEFAGKKEQSQSRKAENKWLLI